MPVVKLPNPAALILVNSANCSGVRVVVGEVPVNWARLSAALPGAVIGSSSSVRGTRSRSSCSRMNASTLSCFCGRTITSGRSATACSCAARAASCSAGLDSSNNSSAKGETPDSRATLYSFSFVFGFLVPAPPSFFNSSRAFGLRCASSVSPPRPAEATFLIKSDVSLLDDFLAFGMAVMPPR